MQTTNPIKALRLQRGLKQGEFAILLGISYPHLSWAEGGQMVKLPPSLRRGLAALGYDDEKINQEYIEWRAWKREQLLAKEKKKHSVTKG